MVIQAYLTKRCCNISTLTLRAWSFKTEKQPYRLQEPASVSDKCQIPSSVDLGNVYCTPTRQCLPQLKGNGHICIFKANTNSSSDTFNLKNHGNRLEVGTSSRNIWSSQQEKQYTYFLKIPYHSSMNQSTLLGRQHAAIHKIRGATIYLHWSY